MRWDQTSGPAVARERVLDDRELVALWRAAKGLGYPTGPIVQMLALTGSRLREISEMQWSEIDLDRAMWVLPAGGDADGG